MSSSTWLQANAELDDNISTDIEDLVKERGTNCVSIIVPTHRFGQYRQMDLLEVLKAIRVAKKLVWNLPGDFLLSIDDLFQQIEFKKNKEGIGIFVSPRVRKLVQFPFPVTKKIVVNKFFHLHDLLYIENYKTPYFLLDLSRKKIHLFWGMMDHLEEMNDANFPRKILEEYEYNKPSQSSSDSGYAHVKGFEKDKSELQLLRLKKVFQEVDKLLPAYLLNQEVPLILCGPERDVSLFKSITRHSRNIVSSITDNYSGTQTHDLELFAWMEIRSHIDKQKLKLIEEFREKLGNGLGVYGIENVWKASKEGSALMLLVEKDYERSAFVTEDGELHLELPVGKHASFPDVVNEIITTVLAKDGKVTIVEKDALLRYRQIALIKRY